VDTFPLQTVLITAVLPSWATAHPSARRASWPVLSSRGGLWGPKGMLIILSLALLDEVDIQEEVENKSGKEGFDKLYNLDLSRYAMMCK